ncbi:putative holin [Vibrio phage vB_ValP_FGH]|nr:putative holin [Vibrio phage vB_ValP_FGH]
MTCQYYELDFLLTAAITGICAHNGTRSLYLIGEILKKNQTAINRIVSEPPVDNSARMAKKKEQDNGDDS